MAHVLLLHEILYRRKELNEEKMRRIRRHNKFFKLLWVWEYSVLTDLFPFLTLGVLYLFLKLSFDTFSSLKLHFWGLFSFSNCGKYPLKSLNPLSEDTPSQSEMPRCFSLLEVMISYSVLLEISPGQGGIFTIVTFLWATSYNNSELYSGAVVGLRISSSIFAESLCNTFTFLASSPPVWSSKHSHSRARSQTPCQAVSILFTLLSLSLSSRISQIKRKSFSSSLWPSISFRVSWRRRKTDKAEQECLFHSPHLV